MRARTCRRALRWVCIACTAVPLALTLAHVAELPNKMALDGELWLAIQQHLYRGWGPFAAPFELTAIVATWALLLWQRRRSETLGSTAVAALCLSSTLLVFFTFNAPVNAALSGWTAESLPADWPSYRLRWEIGHALACVLGLTAFIALLRAAIIDGAEQPRHAARETAGQAGRQVVPLAERRVVRLRARRPIARLLRDRPT
jgi:hypothetical protein